MKQNSFSIRQNLRDIRGHVDQTEISRFEREYALLEEKLRNARQLAEERLKNSDDRVVVLEKEITAARYEVCFLISHPFEQELDSFSQATS